MIFDSHQGIRRRAARLAASILLVGSCALAAAQVPTTQPADDAEPPVPSTQPAAKKPALALDEFSVNLGFQADAEKRTARTDSAGLDRPRFAQTNKRYRFEETLGLEGRGSIVDERILQYDAMARFGLSQERFTEDRPGPDEVRTPDGTILECDLNFHFLPRGKISANAFASQLDDRIPRPFLPSLDRRRERYGAGVTYNDPKLPMSLTYEHLFDDLTSGSRSLVDDEERGEDTLRYEATWQPTEDHALSLEAEHERRSEQYSGTRTRFDTERNFLALTDTIQFGYQDRSRLETYLRLEEESGDLQRDAFEFSPLLRFQHTDSFFTTYRAQYLDESFANLAVKTLRGDWGATHEWRDMLTTSVGLYGLQQQADRNADTTEWGTLFNASFNRRNDLGRFRSNLSWAHTSTRTDGGGRTGIIIDESITFRDPLAPILTQRNIDPLSILVRAADRADLYLEGFDYVVLRNGDATAIQRVANGRIADGDTVLVSYTYSAFSDFVIGRDRVDWRIQQELIAGLDAYYALSLQDEDVNRSRYLTFRERDINRHRVGLTYRRPRWSSGLELEYNDDNIDPYQAAHANGDIILFQDARQQVDARGAYSFFRFDGVDTLDPRQTQLVDLSLNYRYSLGRDLEASAAALYRYQDDSLFGTTNGVDLSASLAYRIGEFSLLVEAEYDMLDLPQSSDDSVGVWLKLRRDIPLIGKRAVR